MRKLVNHERWINSAVKYKTFEHSYQYISFPCEDDALTKLLTFNLLIQLLVLNHLCLEYCQAKITALSALSRSEAKQSVLYYIYILCLPPPGWLIYCWQSCLVCKLYLKKKSCWSPTDHFAIVVPWNPPIGKVYAAQKRRLAGFQFEKLWNVRSGRKEVELPPNALTAWRKD